MIENVGIKSRDYSVLKAPKVGGKTQLRGLVKLDFVELCRFLLGSMLIYLRHGSAQSATVAG